MKSQTQLSVLLAVILSALLCACGDISQEDARKAALTYSATLEKKLQLDLREFDFSGSDGKDGNGYWHFCWQRKSRTEEKVYLTVGGDGIVEWTASEEFLAARGIRKADPDRQRTTRGI